MIRVLIADDHPLMRTGLKHILAECEDMVLAAEADNGFDALAAIREGGIDVAVLDMNMPGRSGIDLIKQIKVEQPKLPLLVLSAHKEDIYAVRTIKAGASGYLCKDYASSELVGAIRKVAARGCYISPAVAELMVKSMHPKADEALRHTLLSDREYQVFLMIAEGRGSTEIADRLMLSIKTVSTHKQHIKEKMALKNVSEFIRYAIRHGLVAGDDGTSGG